MDCTHCGAPVRDDGAFCSHCGSRLPRPESPAPAHLAATATERFERARSHPEFQAACNHVPVVPVANEFARPLLLIAVAIGFSAFFRSMPGPPEAALINAFVTGIVLVMIGASVVMLVRAQSFRAAPIVHDIMVVIDERVAVSGGDDRRTRTTYFATLQDQDGLRSEHRCEGWLAGRIAAGDIGVAFLKGDRLVDFVRIEV
ncbi:zinc-ribbon domain-containing protein [Nannocystis sp. SCPEA4]|uniref:zinc-ribbon domain-containing protein n=1 Tax=Nannocystis sp. SCPEA4 TaxID=2996787 RepID=UPI00226EE0EA|nr:zinc-ribbon domain-containing protein [Nannocystis sp. SCPEA4]MCY1055630.1 zinc-ribbon domain-containing protein [Nannocystis sp. SCPEA4]